jgi:putative flippase GtrA
MIAPSALKQLFRYGVIGGFYNAIGYLIYLLITLLGVEPKLVVCVVYPTGALISYLANKKWSFSYEGRYRSSLATFIVAHFFGYGINLGFLYFFVDMRGYPHELIQIAAILSVALFLFFALRYFVFPEDKNCTKPA